MPLVPRFASLALRVVLVLSICVAVGGCALLGGGQRGPAISVYVVDADTDEPLVGSQVALGTLPARAVDRDARAEWPGLDPGTYEVRAEAQGWLGRDTVLTVTDRRESVTLVLEPVANRALAGIEAVDALRDPQGTEVLQRRGFYRRRESRTGAFLTSYDIERSGARLLSDVFTRVNGVRVDRGLGTPAVVSVRRGCRLEVYLNGVEARSSVSQLDSIPVDYVVGIEVYRGVSDAPAEFQRRRAGSCGSIVIWTLTNR